MSDTTLSPLSVYIYGLIVDRVRLEKLIKLIILVVLGGKVCPNYHEQLGKSQSDYYSK